MTAVSVSYGHQNPTHDVSLSDSTITYGLIYQGGTRALQEIPLSPPAQQFEIEQTNWIGGRGRNRYGDDPTGYADDFFLWSTSEGKLMPSLQWRFAKGIRNNETSMPADNQAFIWWKLWGTGSVLYTARYLSTSFTASASYNTASLFMIIRRRGTPGTLTAEICVNGVGDIPSTVGVSITKTVSDITDTISVVQLFATSAYPISAAGVYHVKIYGAATDSDADHWEVLTTSAASGKYSANGSAWQAANGLYFRITDADISCQWRYFMHEGQLYAVSQADAGSTPILLMNGVRGTATSATSTTLTCSGLSMTTNRFAGALIRIFDGTGDGQVRTITSNTGTQFTVPTWDITPDTTSKFVVYGTDWWTTIAGHGLSQVTGRPVSTGTIAYIPQGFGVAAIRRMRVNAASHDFGADGVNGANLLNTHVEGATLNVVAADWSAGAIRLAPVVTWGTDLTFGGYKYIGTTDYRITNLISHSKTLYVFKDDGPYTYTGGQVEKLGSGFSDAPDRYCGVGLGAQNQYLWFGWNHSVQRMLGSNVDDMLNFKLGYDGIPTNRRGVVSSIVSAVGWLFVIIDGGSSNFSSITVWNGMGWHEVYRGWATGVRIRNAIWQPILEGRGRLWFDIGGDMAYIEFPQYAANPLKDTSLNFNYEGVVVTATYDAHDQHLYKILQDLRVFTEAGSVEIDYQTNANVGTSTWTVLGTADSQPVEDIALDLGEIFQVRFRFRLQTATSRTAPVMTGWQLSGRQMPLPKYQYVCTFRAISGASTKTGETDHDPNSLYTQLVSWAETQKKLTMRTLANSSDNRSVTISLPAKFVDWLRDTEWGGRISITIMET